MQRFYVSQLMPDIVIKQMVLELYVGVETIEFSISDNLDHLEERLQNYKKRWKNMGEPELTVHGPFLDLNPMSFDSMVHKATMTRYEQSYQAARELGASKIIYHSGFIPSINFIEGWAERMIDFYQEFLDDKPGDIQILMENVLDPVPDTLLEVASTIKHSAFGICLDMGHAHCYSKIPCMKWIELLEPYICHLHIHDNTGDRDSHLAFGDGTLPVRELAEWIKEHPQVTGTFECRCADDVVKSRKFFDE